MIIYYIIIPRILNRNYITILITIYPYFFFFFSFRNNNGDICCIIISTYSLLFVIMMCLSLLRTTNKKVANNNIITHSTTVTTTAIYTRGRRCTSWCGLDRRKQPDRNRTELTNQNGYFWAKHSVHCCAYQTQQRQHGPSATTQNKCKGKE